MAQNSVKIKFGHKAQIKADSLSRMCWKTASYFNQNTPLSCIKFSKGKVTWFLVF